MRLCRFDDARLGVLRDGMVHDVTAATEILPELRWPAPPGDHAVRHLAALRAEAERLLPAAPRAPLDRVCLLSPVANPSKVIAAPLNYVEHVAEAAADAAIHSGVHRTDHAGFASPVDKYGLFLKSATSVVGPGEGVTPAFPDRRTDHELEVALVIGTEARNLAPAKALDAVAGWCLALDMSVRGPEDRSVRKSPDGYTVLGPVLVTADEVPDPASIAFALEIGGRPRQRAAIADLTVPIGALIALASRWYTLYPGDVILTGTPDGVGPVETGDVMHARSAVLGEMRVPVR